MNRMAMANRTDVSEDIGLTEIEVAGVAALLDPDGALYLPDIGLLCISDLHLEKGAAFARRGQMLPPWDTVATLRILSHAVARHDPKIILSLGDNFHDRRGSSEMPEAFRAMIGQIASGREMIWVTGNHDPDGVTNLPGLSVDELSIAGLTFRHEPGKAGEGEVAGHLHPAATLYRRDRAVRRPCFASDGKRLIMPSFGVMTGGLDLRHQAFRGLFEPASLVAHMLGKGRLYSLPFTQLR
ncbi:ligase-associated DNA damage response endonuclease PdeM [Rhizobium alvei]